MAEMSDHLVHFKLDHIAWVSIKSLPWMTERYVHAHLKVKKNKKILHSLTTRMMVNHVQPLTSSYTIFSGTVDLVLGPLFLLSPSVDQFKINPNPSPHITPTGKKEKGCCLVRRGCSLWMSRSPSLRREKGNVPSGTCLSGGRHLPLK